MSGAPQLRERRTRRRRDLVVGEDVLQLLGARRAPGVADDLAKVDSGIA
jgi:hypothetical protein